MPIEHKTRRNKARGFHEITLNIKEYKRLSERPRHTQHPRKGNTTKGRQRKAQAQYLKEGRQEAALG